MDGSSWLEKAEAASALLTEISHQKGDI